MEINKKKQKESMRAIKAARFRIEEAQAFIDKIAKKEIEDFHWLDYSVSFFWECSKSPIGMCLFHVDNMGRKLCCRYCENPVERK